MLLKELISEGVKTISVSYPEGEAREMVFVFLSHALGIQRHTHIVDPEHQVEESDVLMARNAFRRMADCEPLQYVMGKAFFYGRDFNVTPSVLIPRPETEILCRMVLDQVDLLQKGSEDDRAIRILDLCTGSGCIAWTLALEILQSEVIAVDLSSDALEVASSQNFREELKVRNSRPPVFTQLDVLSSVPEDLGQFDVIVSNPPYVMESEKLLIRRNVLEHEPHMALFVPDNDPLIFYRSLAQWTSRLLRKGGLSVVEINEALGKETADIFIAAGMSEVEVIKDFSGKERFVCFRR